MLSANKTARIFNIQKYSIYDGDGIRTLVFFKGCPLRCKWCSNPESVESGFQVMKQKSLCDDCGICADVCPRNIHKMRTTIDGRKEHFIDREISCSGCRVCEESCPKNALKVMGQDMTIPEIMDIILQDTLFYLSSNGGVTLGGGEVTYQGAFAVELLAECKKNGIHTAIETCGYTKWETMQKFIDVTDLFLFDIKHFDPERHRELVGARNERIMTNLEQLFQAGANVSVRMPLIKGLNDSMETLKNTVLYIKKIQTNGYLKSIDILPYHKLGVAKYEQLGQSYPLQDVDMSYTDDELEKIREYMAQFDLPIRVVKH
ncbi:choline TMA-lyase-activating enzyme [Enterococcus quebecensis]|uniref:Choline trimethylamine-lyase activating enzyme n=1 Tax=Enterococcus quebecensis TaxID=903983 RepID=A0A1E5H245_9ENTE|nr:choline TMA-lyase-activating enzyme [Enterococcus quebecensis]OEG18885.1 choline TMA-lyase-activating enzyme [Enterococcus quebecensis]OJG71296.1 glycyl-radical enzyme activating protein family [Enterococcus quebecensis]